MSNPNLLPVPSSRTISQGLWLAVVVLWGFAGWTWWVLVPLLGGLVVLRLVSVFLPQPLQAWSLPALGLLVGGYLLTQTTIRAALVAAGVVVLALAWLLRWAAWRWARWVALVAAVGLIGGGGIAEYIVQTEASAQNARMEQLDRAYRIAELRPTSGGTLVRLLAMSIAQNDTRKACWHFTPTAAASLAVALDVDTCPEAIALWHKQITPPLGRYAGVRAPREDVGQRDQAGLVKVSACRLYITRHFDVLPLPGPQLGQFVLAADPAAPRSRGLMVKQWAPCGASLPGMPGTSTTPTPPPILPSYPPQLADVLVRAIAARDGDVCDRYLTATGRRQVAAAYRVPDCAAAIAALGDQVRDAARYRTPRGADHSRPRRDTAVVDACRLKWDRFGDKAGTPAPGPQVGHLTLVPGPEGQGWLIDQYRRC